MCFVRSLSLIMFLVDHKDTAEYTTNGFKNCKWRNSSIWLIDGYPPGTATFGQNEPGSNGRERIYNTHQAPESDPHYEIQISDIAGKTVLFDQHIDAGIREGTEIR